MYTLHAYLNIPSQISSSPSCTPRVLDVGGEYRELRNGAVDVLPGQAVVQVAWSPEGQMVVLTTVCVGGVGVVV